MSVGYSCQDSVIDSDKFVEWTKVYLFLTWLAIQRINNLPSYRLQVPCASIEIWRQNVGGKKHGKSSILEAAQLYPIPLSITSAINMESSMGEHGAFKPAPAAQSQNKPGWVMSLPEWNTTTKMPCKIGGHNDRTQWVDQTGRPSCLCWICGFQKTEGQKRSNHWGRVCVVSLQEQIYLGWSFLSSGIGRSVAILMAREGADVTIVYLPSEQPDAETTKRTIEQEKRACLLIPGDLRDRNLCRHTVDEHVKKSA